MPGSLVRDEPVNALELIDAMALPFAKLGAPRILPGPPTAPLGREVAAPAV
jgi:hypothetical protein